jgi:hypothetical protein
MGPPPWSSALLEGGEAGILVPPRDQEALAAALVRVLTDDKLLAETRARSQRNIGRMSLSRVAEETLEVYRDALTAKLSAQRAPRPPLSGSRHIENMGRRRCVGSRGEPSLHAREGGASIPLGEALFTDRPQFRTQRFGGLAAVSSDADPGPDRCRPYSEARPNNDRLINSKESLMFLLELTVDDQGLGF